MTKVGGKLTPQQRTLVDDVCWRLRTSKLWTYSQIVEHIEKEHGISVHKSTLKRRMDALSKKISKELDSHVRTVKFQQQETLEYIAAEALAAWERSKEPTKSVKQTKTHVLPSRRKGDEQGEQDEQVAQGDGLTVMETETETSIKELLGDTRYLDTAMKALADIRDIFGVNAPTKVDNQFSDGELIVKVVRE